MKTANIRVAKPYNTKAKGAKTTFYDWRNDPKHEDKVKYKRARTVRKIRGQVTMLNDKLEHCTVYLVRQEVVSGSIAEFYMLRTYKMEWSEEDMGDIIVYKSKRLPCRKTGDITWEILNDKEFHVNGEVIQINTNKTKKDAVEFGSTEFEADIDNSFNTIDANDFDSVF